MTDAKTRPAEPDQPGRDLLPAAVESLSHTIADSYLTLLGKPLLSVPRSQLTVGLYRAPFALLAHDGGEDPVFTYANLTAQRLWQRDWAQFVGLPSRLSAEPDDRETRARMLAQVAQTGFISDYTGVRVSAGGQRFRIEGAEVWNLADGHGRQVGQAARIGSWSTVSR